MPLSEGTRLGRYEIRSKIGAGGMGEVYLAYDTTLERLVALKVLPAEVASVPDRMRRFVQEAKTASSLNHPNIITIHEIDQSATGHFIVTEFVDGDTLRNLERSGPLPLADVLEIAIQIASALTAAHGAGIVHRDIKPENIMRRSDGVVKVLDFGLAKLSERSRTGGSPSDTTLPTLAATATEAGVVLGTALYMSPEQARGLPVDARTDVFSLGVVLYEMVARRLPFEGSNTNEIIASLLGDKDPAPMVRDGADVPAEFERIVVKALRKDREQRYQTVKDLLLDLKSLKQAVDFGTHASRGSSSARAVISPAPTAATGPVAAFATYRRSLVLAVALSAVVVVALSWVSLRRATSTTAIDSIAVMPFENRTRDDSLEYLSDGITESLINSLSRVPKFRVIARSSVFSYKNHAPGPREVGRQLSVRAVLTGRVMMQGDTLDVRAELTDTQTDNQLWGDHFTRRAADFVAVQDEIARQVTDALRVQLSGGEVAQLTKNYTQNAEAYRLYLQGRYFFNAGSEEDLNRAVSFFDRAVTLDPQFALAYAARAEAYFAMGDLSLPMKQAMPKAKEDVLKALNLDDTVLGARTLLATIKFQYEWDFGGADEDFRRVIAVNPNDAEARHQYMYLLAMTGRHMEAVSQIQRAQQLDPVNPSIAVDGSLPYFLARQYEESIAAGRKALDLFPNFFLPHLGIGSALVESGDVKAGIGELEKAKALEPTPLVLGSLAYSYAKAGRQADARRLLNDLKDQAATRYVASYWPALIYAGLNEKDEAFVWLGKAYEERSWWLVWTKTDPRLDTLRSDSRFTDLMRRVGFP